MNPKMNIEERLYKINSDTATSTKRQTSLVMSSTILYLDHFEPLSFLDAHKKIRNINKTKTWQD